MGEKDGTGGNDGESGPVENGGGKRAKSCNGGKERERNKKVVMYVPIIELIQRRADRRGKRVSFLSATTEDYLLLKTNIQTSGPFLGKDDMPCSSLPCLTLNELCAHFSLPTEIQSNVAKLVDMMATLQNNQHNILDRLTVLEKLCTELTQNNNPTILSAHEHSTETQPNDTNLLDFLSSDNFDLTTLLQDSTETEHSPISLPTSQQA